MTTKNIMKVLKSISIEEFTKYLKSFVIVLGLFGINIELTQEQIKALFEVLAGLYLLVTIYEGRLKRKYKKKD